MIRVTCKGGVIFEGRSLESIMRREFGQSAFWRGSANHNEPEIGFVLIPTRHDPRQYLVAAEILTIETLP